MQRPPETETGFQEAVVELASLRGWLHFHDLDSRRNRAGFPDLVLTRSPRLIFAELKTQTGRISPDQQLWLDSLIGVEKMVHQKVQQAYGEFGGDRGPFVQAFLWRPSDWPEIEAALR